MYESKDKMVSHPNHYEIKPGVEVIDIIEAVTKDMKGVEATDTANIIKYACRWKKKNGIQDLEKLIWYATHLVGHLKKKMDSKANSSMAFPILFDSKRDVENTLERLKILISQYGFASAGNLFKIIDRPTHENLNNYGWTDISSAKIKPLADGGYLLLLPEAVPIQN